MITLSSSLKKLIHSLIVTGLRIFIVQIFDIFCANNINKQSVTLHQQRTRHVQYFFQQKQTEDNYRVKLTLKLRIETLLKLGKL